MPGASVRDALAGATDALAAAGVETPRLDAELLLADALGVERETLAALPEGELRGDASRAFAAAVRRRLAREPVAQILGRKGFRRIELAVDARVLTPRPESELLVEVALELRPRWVLDVGTGSGAIALAIADELPEARVWGCDTSAAALEVARANAALLGLADRVALAERPPPGESFDLLVANLPYVSEPDYAGLAPEIVRHEPREAIVGGPTGLEQIETLLGELAIGAMTTAAVALEVGEGQAATVAELIRRAGFERVGARPDLAGIDRVVVGRDRVST